MWSDLVTDRKSVPTNVRRRLWAEAMGHCMNPACGKELIRNDANIGQMAHIIPHPEKGDVSFDNLLLLCSECHKIIDDGRTDDTVARLRRWKKDRNNFICQNFSQQYETFDKLRETVLPILGRNYQIFRNYGPINQDLQNSERHNLWLIFEPEIISNNAKLETLLVNNKGLIHKRYHSTVDEFVSHVREFVETRDVLTPRVRLFPEELLSIFGIEEAIAHKSVQNVAALQNFICHLERETDSSVCNWNLRRF